MFHLLGSVHHILLPDSDHSVEAISLSSCMCSQTPQIFKHLHGVIHRPHSFCVIDRLDHHLELWLHRDDCLAYYRSLTYPLLFSYPVYQRVSVRR
jgi:hypothetical protein